MSDGLNIRIVEIVKDLVQRLGISNFEPNSIVWLDYVPRGRMATGPGRGLRIVPYDGCLVKEDEIVLPASMRERLEPEDWGPLLAPELAYSRKLRGKRIGGMLLRILPPLVVYALLPFLLLQYANLGAYLQGTTYLRGARVPVLVAFLEIYSGTVLLASMILYILLGMPYARRSRLLADREAAEVVGIQRLVQVLRKVGEVHPELLKGKRPSFAYPPGRPGIQKRIESVQSVQT